MNTGTRKRLLGGILVFCAFVVFIYGFGTSQSNGSFVTFLVAAALGVAGALMIRGPRHRHEG